MDVRPVRWGVLGVAKIGSDRVLPHVMTSELVQVVAIASRSIDRASASAAALGIPHAYGNYDALLADPEVEAVYIPLPNHMHVDWTLRAIQAGKHALCEKPYANTALEAVRIQDAATRRGVLAMEAFMLFSHPRIKGLREAVRTGAIGRLGSLRMSFSNPNLDPANIRNRVETGGGALLDKGCYAVAIFRYLYEAEPVAITAASEIHPAFGVDTLTTAILKFAEGMASFDCSSALAANQQLLLIGTEGHIEVDLPVTPDPDKPTAFIVTTQDGARTTEFAACNQYRLMFEEVSAAIRQHGKLPVPPKFSVGNARVIEQLIKAAAERRWQ